MIPEDLAVDPDALALVHAEWRLLDDQGRCAFNDYLVGAITANLTAGQVSAAIKIAKSCMDRANARMGDDPGEAAVLDHDRLTDAAQDGWGR